MQEMEVKPATILSDGTGEILYWPGVWKDSLFDLLDQTMRWRQDHIKMFGRKIPIPRLTAWYGDPDAVYRYSGIVNIPLPWPTELVKIKLMAETCSNSRFNAVLANRYLDGNQHQAYHADDEPELGEEPVIASASFGGTRRFLIKEKGGPRRFAIDLEDGSLLIMRGKLQEHFVHSLAKTRKPVMPRINLTFRRIFAGPSLKRQ